MRWWRLLSCRLAADSSRPRVAHFEEPFGIEPKAGGFGFADEHAKSHAEIPDATANRKLTQAQLDVQEQKLNRSKRGYRDLRTQGSFGASTTSVTECQVKACGVLLGDFAECVCRVRER